MQRAAPVGPDGPVGGERWRARQPQRPPRARRRDVQNPRPLVPVALANQVLQVAVEVPLLLPRTDEGNRRKEVGEPTPRGGLVGGLARQVEPAQQAPLGGTRCAIEGRHQHVVELETLGAVDRHHLHGVFTARRSAEEMLEDGLEIFRHRATRGA